MKTLRITLLAIALAGGVVSCTTTKEVPNPEVLHAPDAGTPAATDNSTTTTAE